MKSSLKKIKDCKVKLLVEVEAKRVEDRFQQVFKDFQRGVTLPGFREGKAPFDLIEKKFTKEAEEEVLKSLIPEAYHQSVATHKLSPVTLPAIADIKLQRGKGLTFSAEFEKSPEFSLKNYKGIKIQKIPFEVSAEDVEKGVASLLDSRSELVPLLESRAVQQGDFIVTDVESWREGQYVPMKQGALLFVGPSPEDDFYEKIVGSQVNEAREVSADPSEEEKKQGLVGRKPLYKIWVRSIQEKKSPDFDDAFAKTFGTESAEQLREAIRKDIAAHKRTESYEKMKEELFTKLLSLTSFSVPDGLVEKQKERLIEQARRQYEKSGLSSEKFEQQKSRVEADAAEKARNQVKLYFILQKIADQEGVEIDEIELEKKLSVLAAQSKRSIEEVRRVFEEDLRESMRETKTVEFLLANARLEEEKSK